MELESLRYIVRAKIIKLYSKTSWKSRSDKTNVRIIFEGDIVFQETFKHIYDVSPIKVNGEERLNWK